MHVRLDEIPVLVPVLANALPFVWAYCSPAWCVLTIYGRCICLCIRVCLLIVCLCLLFVVCVYVSGYVCELRYSVTVIMYRVCAMCADTVRGIPPATTGPILALSPHIHTQTYTSTLARTHPSSLMIVGVLSQGRGRAAGGDGVGHEAGKMTEDMRATCSRRPRAGLPQLM